VASSKTGQPFTCVVYSNLIPWGAKLARELNLPSILLWNQSPAVLDIFYYYFNGYGDTIQDDINDPTFSLKLPGLPPLGSRDHLSSFFNYRCHTWIARRLIKKKSWLRKKTYIWHLVFLEENILFKESPPNIMVTRNPNWSTKILWYKICYVKGKTLSPTKRPTWGRLHCWFCLKLLKNLFSFFPFFFLLFMFLTLVSINNSYEYF
jgi:hypothetical protein